MEPEITEGFTQVRFYSYSALKQELLEASLAFLKAHPEYDPDDIVVGEDEGTSVTLYCRKR